MITNLLSGITCTDVGIGCRVDEISFVKAYKKRIEELEKVLSDISALVEGS